MKKVNLVIALVLMSQIGQAKVSDFNSLIGENIKSQNVLHKEVNDSMNVVKKELNDSSPQNIVVLEAQSYNVPSRKMKFKKETKYFQASDEKNMKRMATEVKDSNQGF